MMRSTPLAPVGPLASEPGVAAISTTTSGMSFRGWLASACLAPMLRLSRRLHNADTLDQAVRKSRARGPAMPPARLHRRFLVEEGIHHGMRTFTVTPRQGRSEATILYLHGGGYTFHLVPPHWTLIAGLAEQTGATVVTPLYPLAPENIWELAFAAVTALYRDLKQTRSGAVFVGGDSAGGGLALALAQEWKAQDLDLPAGLLLFSPFCDGTVSDPVQGELAKRDHMLKICGAREIAKRWAGDLPINDRRISPLFGSVAGLPPLLVIVGSHDILFSDANRLHVRAVADRTEIEIHRYLGMFHVFMALATPEGRRALAQAGGFVRRIMGRP